MRWYSQHQLWLSLCLCFARSRLISGDGFGHARIFNYLQFETLFCPFFIKDNSVWEFALYWDLQSWSKSRLLLLGDKHVSRFLPPWLKYNAMRFLLHNATLISSELFIDNKNEGWFVCGYSWNSLLESFFFSIYLHLSDINVLLSWNQLHLAAANQQQLFYVKLLHEI